MDDDAVIASIPKHVSLFDLQETVKNQIKKYDEDVLRNIKNYHHANTTIAISDSPVDPEISCSGQNYKIVFFIRLPKCASTSFVDILKRLSLALRINFSFNPSGAYNWDSNTISKVAKQVITESQSSPLKYIYSRHFYFVNFYNYNITSFTYVTIVREPVSRIISAYNYYHFSSRPHIQAMLNPNHKNESLKTCLELVHEGCELNLMTKYFCGHEPICNVGSQESYILAKQNIERYFSVIGIVEDMTLTYKLMKHFLPDHFQYLVPESDSKKQQNQHEHETIITDDLRTFIENRNKFDMLLYMYIRQKFYDQARICSLN